MPDRYGSRQLYGFYLRYASRWRNLCYHFRSADWAALYDYQQHWKGNRHLPWLELLKASWLHGASFADYYLFRFFEKTTAQRRTYITTSLRHELTRQLNAPAEAEILKDKVLFAKHFRDLLGRPVWTWEELLAQTGNEAPPRLVVKLRRGQQGYGMHFPPPFENWMEARHWLTKQLSEPQNYVFEAYLKQHPALEALNPDSVNTLRVITCLHKGQVELWGAVLRCGIGPGSDHFSRGGLAMMLDEKGKTCQAAVRKNPFFPPCTHHPLTGVPLENFTVPFFSQVRALVSESARRIPAVRSVGWDVAILPEGPCLIEGNDNWSCHIQIPMGQGFRALAHGVCDMQMVYD